LLKFTESTIEGFKIPDEIKSVIEAIEKISVQERCKNNNLDNVFIVNSLFFKISHKYSPYSIIGKKRYLKSNKKINSRFLFYYIFVMRFFIC
jgi:hypothetical protein